MEDKNLKSLEDKAQHSNKPPKSMVLKINRNSCANSKTADAVTTKWLYEHTLQGPNYYVLK